MTKTKVRTEVLREQLDELIAGLKSSGDQLAALRDLWLDHVAEGEQGNALALGRLRASDKIGVVVPDAPADLWYAYLSESDACGLCGNWGVIDTLGRSFTPAGYHAGVVGFCICPNGRALREQGADLQKHAARRDLVGPRVKSSVETNELATTFARYIMAHVGKLRDHACARCAPESEILEPGFVCAWHRAEDVVGGAR
jgi:hypothetical protein